MQVFLPYPSFQQSVACLDKKRLGNQIWRECKTLLNDGWKHHPVAKMWADYKPALGLYSLTGLFELERRGDISAEAFIIRYHFFSKFTDNALIILPDFIGNPDFHLSHRLNLLWKDPEWYSMHFDEPVPTSKPPYLWPSPQKIGSEMEPRQ